MRSDKENRFEYVWGTVTGEGSSEAEVRRKIQMAENAWMRVERLMADRKISRESTGKALLSCVMPAYLYDLEMVALTETTI